MMTSYFRFLSSENTIPLSHIINKKKYKVKLYEWKLERVIKESNNIGLDIFPSSSDQVGIQENKGSLINQMNARNLFDFEYKPKEGDYLSIKNMANSNEYLNLIYRQMIWLEEVFLFSLRRPQDSYAVIAKGFLDLSENHSLPTD